LKYRIWRSIFECLDWKEREREKERARTHTHTHTYTHAHAHTHTLGVYSWRIFSL